MIKVRGFLACLEAFWWYTKERVENLGRGRKMQGLGEYEWVEEENGDGEESGWLAEILKEKREKMSSCFLSW